MRRITMATLVAIFFSGCASIETDNLHTGWAILQNGTATGERLLGENFVSIVTIDEQEEFTFRRSETGGRVIPAGKRTLEVIWGNALNGQPATARASARITFNAKPGQTYSVDAARLDYGAHILFSISNGAGRRVADGVVAKIYYSP